MFGWWARFLGVAAGLLPGQRASGESQAAWGPGCLLERDQGLREGAGGWRWDQGGLRVSWSLCRGMEIEPGVLRVSWSLYMGSNTGPRVMGGSRSLCRGMEMGPGWAKSEL